jgi:hypothetical protein
MPLPLQLVLAAALRLQLPLLEAVHHLANLFQQLTASSSSSSKQYQLSSSSSNSRTPWLKGKGSWCSWCTATSAGSCL